MNHKNTSEIKIDSLNISQLKKIADGTAEADSQQVVAGFTSSKAPHANCSRSFKRLFESDPTEAKALFERAVQLIISIS